MIDTTQKDVTPTVREMRRLAEEWSKPKTLREIHALVGRFPFKAKAVAGTCGIPTHFPQGTTVTCTGWVNTDEGAAVATPEHPFSRGNLRILGIYPDFARWALVED